MRSKIILSVSCMLFTLFVVAQPETYLYKINKYQEASGFSDTDYDSLNWQQFYKLEEPNEIIDPDNYDFDLMNAACFYALNKYRATKNLSPLRYSHQLRDAATIHTNEMINRNFFDHYNRYDPKIKMPNNRTELCYFSGEEIGENLVRSFMDLEKPLTYIELADKMVNELKKSPEHNQNMLNPRFNLLGCGFLFENKIKDGYIYVRMTQDFGKSW